MNYIQFLQDYGIPYWTEGKNISAGWIGIRCPFCNDHSNHLGYNLDENYFLCWRCGSHPVTDTISKLLGISAKETKRILTGYNTVTILPEVKIRKKSFKYPSGIMSLQTNHKKYLENRNFDPEYLEKEWNLFGTGPLSKLDNINYKYRIIIPFIWDKKVVSFDSRDITGKQIRYLACPAERELIPHKNILYGKTIHR